MANYEKISPSLQNSFDKVYDKYQTLANCVNIKLICDTKLKDYYKPVMANELTKHLIQEYGKPEINVVIFFNEELTDVLEDKQLDIILEESLARIEYDSEKDKITIVDYDLKLDTGLYGKFGDDYVNVIKLKNEMIQQKKDAEEAEKQAKKDKKTKK